MCESDCVVLLCVVGVRVCVYVVYVRPCIVRVQCVHVCSPGGTSHSARVCVCVCVFVGIALRSINLCVHTRVFMFVCVHAHFPSDSRSEAEGMSNVSKNEASG